MISKARQKNKADKRTIREVIAKSCGVVSCIYLKKDTIQSRGSSKGMCRVRTHNGKSYRGLNGNVKSWQKKCLPLRFAQRRLGRKGVCGSDVDILFLSLFHHQAQSRLGVYGSGVHAETGARGVCVLANISNEARVILKAGVPLPW